MPSVFLTPLSGGATLVFGAFTRQLPEAQTVAASTPKILLVEDDADVALVLRTALENGFFVTWASSLSVAAKLLKRETFSAVVLDWHVGPSCGRELLARTDDKDRLAPPVVVMTGSVDLSEHAEAARLGAVQVLMKPFPLGDLADAVTSAIAGRRKPGSGKSS